MTHGNGLKAAEADGCVGDGETQALGQKHCFACESFLKAFLLQSVLFSVATK